MQAGPTGQSGFRKRADRIAGGVIAVLGLYVAWVSRDYPFGTVAEPGPGFLPFFLALVFAAFGLVLAVAGGSRNDERSLDFGELRHALIVLAALGAAAFGIERIGYRALVMALLLFFLLLVERRNVFVSVALAAAMAFGSFYLINNVLRVPLPLGPWGF
jgi:hypothetical protein